MDDVELGGGSSSSKESADDNRMNLVEAQAEADAQPIQYKKVGGLKRVICVTLCFIGWILTYLAFDARADEQTSVRFAIIAASVWFVLVGLCLCPWKKKKRSRVEL